MIAYAPVLKHHGITNAWNTWKHLMCIKVVTAPTCSLCSLLCIYRTNSPVISDPATPSTPAITFPAHLLTCFPCPRRQPCSVYIYRPISTHSLPDLDLDQPLFCPSDPLFPISLPVSSACLVVTFACLTLPLTSASAFESVFF